ncbi:MAG: helix-turn-helix domain-containing protein [Proteobacteria bacterium]|nr:helix-turn-helix domain-containing protein [Pseudomonadota bacterium]
MTSSNENAREGSKLFMGFGAKSTPPEPPAPAGPTELGKLLCATRMRVGKDLQRIADILHIRYNFLVAIEDGRYEDLPGQAYAIGFVRAYADHLGLDGDEIVRRYKEESAGVKHKSAFEFQMPTSDSALPSGTLLLIAVVAGMLIYGVWYSIAGSDRSAVELIQEVPDRLASIADPNTIEAALPVTAGEPGVDPAADGGDLAPAPDASLAGADGAGETAADAGTPPATTTASATGLPVLTDVIELRAKADVWITLRDAKAIERTQFLRKDEVLRLPEQGVTTLVTANANDLEILVNGKTMPPLDAGLFARGVALDPQKLKTSAPPLMPAASAKPAEPPVTPATAPAASTGAPAAKPEAAAPAPSPLAAKPPASPSSAAPAAPAAATPSIN